MFVPVGDHRLNVVSYGRGPAFVAHGGWIGSWELWQDPFVLMQDRWRCTAYDHRGSGISTFPPESITADGLVDDLFSVLDHVGADRCVLAGESLGALTCLQAVLRSPERFDALVLVDAVPAADPEQHLPLASAARADLPGTVDWFVDACVPGPDSEHVRSWGRQILLRAEPEAAARILEAHVEAETVPPLSEISMPTLVLHGEDDGIVPIEVGRSTAAAIPDAEFVAIEGAGHVPTLTHPHAVASSIETWLDRLRSSG